MRNDKNTALIKLHPDTFCNPINISYQYQKGYKSRESADPCIILYKDEYYLFASAGTGYWWSTDMMNWNFVLSKLEDIEKYAPAVCVIAGELYLTNNLSGIYKTTDPKADDWTYVGKPISWVDPAFLVDDDGKVYCYYGCSDVDPIFVVELDPANNMSIINGPIALFNSDTENHGFEVNGNANENHAGACWLEGPWMTKYDGRYYLQYAAPGSEYATYADGCYVSDSPTGPFAYCGNSPISFKASGFIKGAGHGGTFLDLKGKLWRIDTTNISVNHKFERRVIIYRAEIKDGKFHTDLAFADYPMYGTDKGSFGDSRPDWNLLTFKTRAESSSSLVGHEPGKAFNEDFRSWWSAETGNAGEWLMTDMGGLCKMNAVQINFADQDIHNYISGRNNNYCYRYLLEYSGDGENWSVLVDRANAANTISDTSHDYFELKNFIQARYIKLTNCGETPANGKFAVSGLRLFGQSGQNPPDEVKGIHVTRSATDGRMVTISWTASDRAQAYLIRFGTSEDALYTNYQVIDGESVTLRCLNKGVDYYFAVDAYNSGGVTKGTGIVSGLAKKK